jgi:hypothetical protein
LLQEDRPETLPDFPVGESLMLRYKSEQPLPSNTISRFIVRHNRQIKADKTCGDYVWRYGVVLEDGKGSTALVREEDRTISVSVKGKNKTDFIGVLRETLNDIFKSYKTERPELEYRVERYDLVPEILEKQNPLLLPDVKILNHSRDNIPYYDDTTRQYIDLSRTVNTYHITIDTLMIGGNESHFLRDESIHQTFNFYNCNISLQGHLNDLAQLLKESGNDTEAGELEKAAKALELTESCKTKEEVRKKGVFNRVQRLMQDLGDEDTKLHKTVQGVKTAIDIAQDIAQGYNDIAQWLGLPQVPKPFLKKLVVKGKKSDTDEKVC